ncbi:LuxR C-terminal-related transcriptional regulator [Hydrocarboniphaga effusa]|nr:LuxR C-terminal-related transcriptional regulator [Hydrocarboniphaga effusa]
MDTSSPRKLLGELPDTTRPFLLRRDRLLRVDRGLPLFVVEGPAGFGKTVLAELWLERQRSLQAQVGWISLTRDTCEPAAFIQQLWRGIGSDPRVLSERQLGTLVGRRQLFGVISSYFGETQGPSSLVVDNAHCLADADPESQAYFRALLQLASLHKRICITTSVESERLGLNPHAADGRLSWIGAPQLAFTRAESDAFVRVCGHDASANSLDWIFRMTLGWPVLTQIALATPIDPKVTRLDAVPSISAIRCYIHQRIISVLSASERDVLWMLCCLGRAPIALLASLEPGAQAVDSALRHFRQLRLIQDFEHGERSVVGLHPLIRSAAATMLTTDRQRARDLAVEAASDWYWRHGWSIESAQVLLESGFGPTPPVVRERLVQIGPALIFRDAQHLSVIKLSDRWERRNGLIDAAIDDLTSWALIFRREAAAARARLNRIDGENLSTALHRSVLHALEDDFASANALSSEWIDRNRDCRSYLMGVAKTVQAFSERCTDRFDLAHLALRDATELFGESQSTYAMAWVHVVGAVTDLQAGRYRSALARVERGLQECASQPTFRPVRAILRSIEAFLRYERNEVSRLREILSEALPALADQGVVDALVLGYTAAARERADALDIGTALDILAEGEQISLHQHYPRLTLALRTERGLLLLRSGAPAQARAIAEALPAPTQANLGHLLFCVRLEIGDGNGAASRDLNALALSASRQRGRSARLCEALTLQAIIDEQSGRPKLAMAALSEALEIGHVEGYTRLFVDEGSAIHALLDRFLALPNPARSRPADFLARKLSARTRQTGEKGRESRTTVSLNKRERQIIALLNEGLSNTQLAERCFISQGTVKWYLHHLFEKFGVGNRTSLLRAVRDAGMSLS